MAAHRYWRFYIYTTHGGVPTMKSIELRVTSGGSNLALTGNGTASASSISGTQNPAQAFDGDNAGTWWTPNVTPTVGAPEWAQWDFGAGNSQDIGNLRIRNSGYTTNNAASISLMYSDDGVSFTPSINATNPSTIDTWFEYDTNVVVEIGNAALTAPSPTLIARGAGYALLGPRTPVLYGFGGAASNLVGPSPTLAGYSGIAMAFVAPSPTLFAVGVDASGANAAILTAPRQTLSTFGGATAKLTAPLQTLGITGTVTNVGQAALTAPSPTLTTTGTTTALANAALTPPMAKVVGYFGAVASVSITGKATLTASGTTGAVGHATLIAPLFELTATATRQNSGSAILTAPVGRLATTGAAWLVAPGATLTAIGTAVVAVSYEAYALNLKHNPTPGVEPVDELTRYTNYPFDRIVRYKNSYFGMNNTGLYLLEGTTDFATPTPTEVPWSYKTALMDMKSVQLKNVSMAYFGGRMGPAATVSVYVGEASVAPYNYTTPRDATAQNYRQPLGKGLKSRYYAFGASGTGELTLDTLSLDVAVLARKV